MFSETQGRSQVRDALANVTEILEGLPVNTNKAETAAILLARISEHEGVWGAVYVIVTRDPLLALQASEQLVKLIPMRDYPDEG